MKLEDILFCLMDIAEDNDESIQAIESVKDLSKHPAMAEIKNLLDTQTAAIKEVVSLLLLIRDSEGVELTADPDGVYYEAAGRYGVRLGTIMKGDKEDEITRSN